MGEVSKYRITTATLVLIPEGLRNVARTMDVGAIIMATNQAFEGNKLVEVQWEDKTVLMFAQDLRLRTVVAD
jgi:hypothetical protein